MDLNHSSWSELEKQERYRTSYMWFSLTVYKSALKTVRLKDNREEMVYFSDRVTATASAAAGVLPRRSPKLRANRAISQKKENIIVEGTLTMQNFVW